MYLITVCEIPHLVGDGYCHDDANTLLCNYDGGDCCFNVVPLYCAECKCLDTYTGYPIILSTLSPFGGKIE